MRAPLAPRCFRFRCAVSACVLGPGLGCAPPFLAGLSGGGGFLLCGVGCLVSLSRALWPLSPHPLSFGLGCWLFSFFVVCVCMFRCPISRLPAVPGLVLPVLAGWSPCASLGVLSVVPSGWGVWPALVVLAGGLVAVGCFRAPLPPPPPLFSFEGGGLPVPPSALPGLAHTLARIQCRLPGCCWRLRSVWPCSGPTVGWAMYTLRPAPWLCRRGGCARRVRVSLG